MRIMRSPQTILRNRRLLAKSLFMLVPGVLVLAGCAQEVSPTPASGAATAAPISQPASVTHYNPPHLENQDINGPLGGANKNLSDEELAALPMHLRVHFATNSSQVNNHGRKIIRANAQFLLKFPHVDVRIEGNCDQRGTQEYNLALGNRRAEAVVRLLRADGVAASRTQIVSFGKDNLLCYANTPQCWKRNRRADFVYHAVLPKS